jgi:hypothetical protein
MATKENYAENNNKSLEEKPRELIDIWRDRMR